MHRFAENDERNNERFFKCTQFNWDGEQFTAFSNCKFLMPIENLYVVKVEVHHYKATDVSLGTFRIYATRRLVSVRHRQMSKRVSHTYNDKEIVAPFDRQIR